MMKRALIPALAGVVGMVGAAVADPIEGMWKRPASEGGTLERISKCGDRYCVTVASGKNNGSSAGWMMSTGNNRYRGELTDIEADKTYKGKAEVKGNSLVMSGCVLFGIICKSETWTRQ